LSTEQNDKTVNDQRDAQILFYVFISLYNSLHVSSTQFSSSGEKIVPIQRLVTVILKITVTRGSYDTICLSWWWALCARNM